MYPSALALATEWSMAMMLPLALRVAARRGGAGPRDPRIGAATRRPQRETVDAIHVSQRSRRRLPRHPIRCDSRLAVTA